MPSVVFAVTDISSCRVSLPFTRSLLTMRHLSLASLLGHEIGILLVNRRKFRLDALLLSPVTCGYQRELNPGSLGASLLS